MISIFQQFYFIYIDKTRLLNFKIKFFFDILTFQNILPNWQIISIYLIDNIKVLYRKQPNKKNFLIEQVQYKKFER